jgi:hypothetical protein
MLNPLAGIEAKRAVQLRKRPSARLYSPIPGRRRDGCLRWNVTDGAHRRIGEALCSLPVGEGV